MKQFVLFSPGKCGRKNENILQTADHNEFFIMARQWIVQRDNFTRLVSWIIFKFFICITSKVWVNFCDLLGRLKRCRRWIGYLSFIVWTVKHDSVHLTKIILNHNSLFCCNNDGRERDLDPVEKGIIDWDQDHAAGGQNPPFTNSYFL